MYSNQKIILLGDYISLEKFSKLNIIGIIGTSDSPQIKRYPYEYLLNLPDDVKVIVDDEGWAEKRVLELENRLKKLKLCIVEDYIYNSMLGGKLNTNRIFCLVEKDQKKFDYIIRKIVGNRKLIILHGNCQVHAIGNMLSSNEEFVSQYVVCETPRLWVVQDANQWTLFFDSEILRMIDYLFVQQIAKDTRWGYTKSTEYVTSQLSNKCSVITITKLFFMGYFPQLKLTHLHNKISFYKGKIGWMDSSVCIDKEILKLILDDSEGEFRTAEKIVDIISTDDYYKKDVIKKKIESELRKFEFQEENVEIKMCDYLKQNYDKFLMFVTEVHPTRKVLEEFTRRILKRLHIKDLKLACSMDEIQYPMPPNNRFVIYPSVLKALNFPEPQYVISIGLQGEEWELLLGIKPEMDSFINENMKSEQKYSMTLQLNFKQYMLLSVRVLQSVIHI